MKRIRRIRELLSDATISTDLITGFPGETEEDFQETLSLYEEVGYDMSYMFIYSEREGTPAALHFEDVSREVKVERLGRLASLQKEISLERNQRWVGREVEVLIKGRAEEHGFVQGHTRGNHVVVVQADLQPGIHRVQVVHATPHQLYCRPATDVGDLQVQKVTAIPLITITSNI